MRVKLTALALVLLGLGSTLPALAEEELSQSHITISPMLEFMDSGREPGPDDYSVLARWGNRVYMEIETSGLDASTAYTVWAVIFNRSQYCTTTPCGLADLPISPGHDPRVQASVAYVTGGFSGADGTLLQEGQLYRARNGVKPTQTLFGPGLLNSERAEIHFVLRGHGPDPGDPLLAFGSYNAGCSDDNPCGDHQVTVHVPR